MYITEFEDQEDAVNISNKADGVMTVLNVFLKKINDADDFLHKNLDKDGVNDEDELHTVCENIYEIQSILGKLIKETEITLRSAEDYDPSDIDNMIEDETAMYKARAL